MAQSGLCKTVIKMAQEATMSAYARFRSYDHMSMFATCALPVSGVTTACR